MKSNTLFSAAAKIVLTSTLILGASISFSSCNKDDQKDKKGTHESVDLGLSVLWATCNVGAYTPESYGNYYAWGEVVTKNMYSPDNYLYFNAESLTMNKYCSADGKTSLDPADDAAHVIWGGKWRMPTKQEFQDLIDKCTWEWDDVKKGCNVSNNGKSIFLPAAGFIGEGGEIQDNGQFHDYWTSELYNVEAAAFGSYEVESGSRGILAADRHYGLTIRPVKAK